MLLLSVYFIVVIFATLYDVVDKKRFSVNINPFLKALTLLCVVLSVSSFFSPLKITAFKSFLYFLLPVLAILLTTILSPEENQKIPIKHIFYSGIIPASITFILYLIQGRKALILFFGNQNWMASYLVLCLVFYFFNDKKDIYSHMTGLLYFAMILLSGSRTAILSIFFLLVLYIIFRTEKKKRTQFIIFTICFILLTGTYLFLNDFRFSSIYYRIYNLFLSIGLLSDPGNFFFGTGPGTYSSEAGYLQALLYIEDSIPDLFTGSRSVITHAHNEFAEIAVEGGVFALLTVLYMLYYALKRTFLKKEYIQFSFLMIYTLMSLFTFPFHLAPHILVFYLILTNILSKDAYNRTFKLSFIHLKKIRIMLVIILILSLFRFTISPMISSILTSNIVKELNPLYDSKEFQSSLEKTYKISFFDPEPLIQLMWSKVLINDNKKADTIYRERIRFMKYDSNVFLSLAYINIDNNEFEKAEDNLFKSMLFSKNFIKPALIGREMYFNQKRPLKAADFLEKSYRFLRKSEFLMQAGELYFRSNKKDSATSAFKKIIENKRFIGDDNKEAFLKIANFRLYQLTDEEEYLEKAKKFDVKTSIDESIRNMSSE